MDSAGFVFESVDIYDAINELEEQYGESTYGTVKFSLDELRWIGYIYRYWAYISGRSSKQIYGMIKPGKLRQLYFPYHSLDTYKAIERITEESGIGIDEDLYDISKGVAAMRKVRKKPSKVSV